MSRADFEHLEDLGHGVAVERMYIDGQLEGLAFFHGDCESYIPLKPANADGWTVESLDPLQLSPSLLCRSCGNHGFIRGGKWIPV